RPDEYYRADRGMRRLGGKFGFIHRLLWERDGLWRAALLLGPASLVGCALAVALWAGVQAVTRSTVQPPKWATVQNAAAPATQGGQPITVQPARPLPPFGPDGSLSGVQPGWIVTGHQVQVTATLDVNVVAANMNNFSVFSLPGPDIDLARI